MSVSVIGLGTWAMGNDFWGTVDDNVSIKTIQTSIDAGINFIDTAPAYGQDQHAEEIIGKAIKGRRDKVLVATKVGTVRYRNSFERNLRPDNIRKQIETSLRKIGIDSIDLYQIHWPDKATPLEESLEVLRRLQEEGKFRYFGVSNFSVDLIEKTKTIIDVVSLQPPYSLLKREIEKNLLPYCRENNLGVLGYGSLAGGILTGKFRNIPELREGDKRNLFYPFFSEPLWGRIQKLLDVLRVIAESRNVLTSQVAINWSTQQPGITCALVGAKNPEQAAINAASAGWELSQQELYEIENAWKKFIKDSIP